MVSFDRSRINPSPIFSLSSDIGGVSIFAPRREDISIGILGLQNTLRVFNSKFKAPSSRGSPVRSIALLRPMPVRVVGFAPISRPLRNELLHSIHYGFIGSWKSTRRRPSYHFNSGRLLFAYSPIRTLSCTKHWIMKPLNRSTHPLLTELQVHARVMTL